MNKLTFAFLFLFVAISHQNNAGHGEILLSLNYLPSAGRLNIDVIKAKQLLQRDIGRGSGIRTMTICTFKTHTFHVI